MMAAATAVGAAAAAGALSARFNWWRPKVSGIPTLMYHKIGDYPRGSQLKKLWVTATDFRRQMLYLKSHGYTALHFSNWRDAEAGKISMPAKPVLVTFDDGYANN